MRRLFAFVLSYLLRGVGIASIGWTLTLGTVVMAQSELSGDAAVQTERLQQLALQSDPKAQFEYARRMETASGVHDVAAATKWYEEAAHNGYTPAAVEIARLSLRGNAVERDLPRAVKWLLFAANRGDERGEVLVGLCYHLGVLRYDGMVEKSMSAIAGLWLRQLVEEPELGKWYLIEADWNMANFVIEPMPSRARLWFDKAAAQGNEYANFWLANRESTHGVSPPNYFERAVSRDNPYFLGEVATVHQLLAAEDPQLRKAAEDYARRARKALAPLVDKGDPDAIQLVLHLASPDQDLIHKLELRQFGASRRLAEKGDPRLQCATGDLVMTGQGTKEDHKEGAKWYAKAAAAGYAIAQYRLGLYYQRGVGVPRNEAEAARWFARADEQGLTRVVGVASGFY